MASLSINKPEYITTAQTSTAQMISEVVQFSISRGFESKAILTGK